MAGSTIGQLVDRVGRLGDRVALEGEDATYTFAGLKRAVDEFSAAAGRAGVRPGDRAAIWAPNSSRWVVAALGLGRIGCVLVPINTRFRGDEAHYILKRARARMLLTTERFLSTSYLELVRGSTAATSGSGRLVPGLPDLERVVIMDADSKRADSWERFQQGLIRHDFESAQRACDLTAPSSPLDLMFTSGTTGFPKAVPMTHDQAISTYQIWAEMVGIRSGDTYLISNPFFHNFGVQSWLAGKPPRRRNRHPYGSLRRGKRTRNHRPETGDGLSRSAIRLPNDAGPSWPQGPRLLISAPGIYGRFICTGEVGQSDV